MTHYVVIDKAALAAGEPAIVVLDEDLNEERVDFLRLGTNVVVKQDNERPLCWYTEAGHRCARIWMEIE